MRERIKIRNTLPAWDDLIISRGNTVEKNAMNKREELIGWLNDAYAMERALEIMLEKQSENSDVHRAIRERAGIHLDETRAHIQHVAQCLQMLGAQPSVLKTTASQLLEI